MIGFNHYSRLHVHYTRSLKTVVTLTGNIWTSYRPENSRINGHTVVWNCGLLTHRSHPTEQFYIWNLVWPTNSLLSQNPKAHNCFVFLKKNISAFISIQLNSLDAFTCYLFKNTLILILSPLYSYKYKAVYLFQFPPRIFCGYMNSSVTSQLIFDVGTESLARSAIHSIQTSAFSLLSTAVKNVTIRF